MQQKNILRNIYKNAYLDSSVQIFKKLLTKIVFREIL